MTKDIAFTKMSGAGNDFLLVDARNGRLAKAKLNWRKLAVALCDRRRGIGADGVLAIVPSRRAAALMRIFNADGSEAAMCGNGIRCVAWYLAGRSASDRRAASGDGLRIDTRAGVLRARVRGRRAAIDMPVPSRIRVGLSLVVGGRRLEAGAINTGVPHVVVPVASLDRLNVEELGRQLRHHPEFQPQGTNVDFIATDTRRPGRVRIRTYERGVEGETLACGTGATAAAILWTLQRLGRGAGDGSARPQECCVDVETKSGEVLTVSFRAAVDGNQWRVTNVVMEGPVRVICQGIAPWPPERVE